MLKLMIPVEEYLAEANLLPSTVACYRVYLRYFAMWMEDKDIDIATITGGQLRRWFDIQDWSENTVRIAHAAIRSFVRHTYGDDHPLLRMRIRRVYPTPQRTLTADQVRQLLDSLDVSQPAGLRNMAMLLLMLDTGLRAAEVTRLVLKNLDLDKRELHVRIKGGATGKGVFSDETAYWLGRWLAARESVALPGVKHVFVSWGGNKPGTPLTRDGLRGVFRHMGQKAGLGLISPHDMRRTFATLAIENGASTRLVQIAGRWKHITEVERYTQGLQADVFLPYSPAALVMGRSR